MIISTHWIVGCASSERSHSTKLLLEEKSPPVFRIALLSGDAEDDFPVDSYATAFLARDRRSIWTVRHLFDEWIFTNLERLRTQYPDAKETVLHQKLLETKIDFLLLDHEKSVIFDSRQNEAANFEFIGNPSVFGEEVFASFTDITDRYKRKNIHQWNYRIKPSIIGKLTDVAIIRLPIKLNIVPLTLAKKSGEIGDRVEIVGYPVRSNSSKSPERNFDGSSRYNLNGSIVSAIEILAASEAVQNQDLHASALSLITLFEKRFVYHDIEYAKGMSGAPVLNQDGEVISIQSSGNERGGFGLEPAWIKTLLLDFRL